MYQTILAAVDGSAPSLRALDTAAQMAKTMDARLLVLSVYRQVTPTESTHSLVRTRQQISPSSDVLRDFANEVIKEAGRRARDRGVTKVDTFIAKGHPARTIVDFAQDKNADAIVMGSRGWGDIGAFLLGSVSHKVSSLARCTCITVK